MTTTTAPARTGSIKIDRIIDHLAATNLVVEVDVEDNRGYQTVLIRVRPHTYGDGSMLGSVDRMQTLSIGFMWRRGSGRTPRLYHFSRYGWSRSEDLTKARSVIFPWGRRSISPGARQRAAIQSMIELQAKWDARNEAGEIKWPREEQS